MAMDPKRIEKARAILEAATELNWKCPDYPTPKTYYEIAISRALMCLDEDVEDWENW